MDNQQLNAAQSPALEQANVMRRLKAIQAMRNDKEMVQLLAEFKRVPFNGSYIMQHQIETEEEWAAHWLKRMEDILFASNGA